MSTLYFLLLSLLLVSCGSSDKENPDNRLKIQNISSPDSIKNIVEKLPSSKIELPKQPDTLPINQFEGSYIDNPDKTGYWQRLVIKRLTDSSYSVDITFGGAEKGCNFTGKGKLGNGRIEIDLSTVKPGSEAIMVIEKNADTMSVSTTDFEKRFDLMYFCGGGASLMGDYYKEKK